MKITPVKGTNDYLSSEVELRDFLQNEILKVYKSYGFMRISTPILEDIENLDKSEGGDNLNLIFKILKRGDKLEKALDKKEYDKLADIGLRYDLTLPLTRFYANNREKLPIPFKCIQIDRVYRAERPQKGRLREFTQCDIDILGSANIDSEIEVITATAASLLQIGISGFKVKINNRKVLRNFVKKLGFEEDKISSVCVSIDKLDKIGLEGVRQELLDKNINKGVIERLVFSLQSSVSLEEIEKICGDMQEIQDLKKIIDTITKLSNGRYDIGYDFSLVRGQGYYTGTVFEIYSDKFKGAVAGGGRYDNLVGQFLGEIIPAVGLSIGFERVFSILSEENFKPKLDRKKVALFYENDFSKAMAVADSLRDNYDVSLYEKPKRLGKFLDKLTEFDYYGYSVVGEGGDVKVLKK